MSFDAPNLVSLDYIDVVKTKYLRVNFKSLVEAKLDLTYLDKTDCLDLMNLIIGIRNVQTLDLYPTTVYAIARCWNLGKVLPLFENLINLSFGSCNKKGWKMLPHLLHQTPKLETLTIQSLYYYRGDVKWGTFQVEVLRVLCYGNTAREMEHFRSLVSGIKIGEKVEVEISKGVVVDDDLKKLLENAAPKYIIKLQI